MASLIVRLAKNPPAIQEIPVPFLGWESPWRRDRLPTPVFLGFPGGLAAMRETWVQSLGWKDLLEKGKATYSSIVAWRIP